VAERHPDGRMPGEFLDGSDRDATEGKPRAKGAAQVVESETLNLRPVVGMPANGQGDLLRRRPLRLALPGNAGSRRAAGKLVLYLGANVWAVQSRHAVTSLGREYVKVEVRDKSIGDNAWSWLPEDYSDDEQRLVFGRLDNRRMDLKAILAK